jgi:N-acetylglutamate synthase-like GNAT family acetyltransferase
MVSVIIKRGAAKDILLETRRRVCKVIACGYPPSASFRRRLVLPKISMKELNEKLSVISRVVVHPKYRTIGLGSRLVHDTLSLAGTEYVEMSAVMAKYNPFAEKAGMKKIAKQQPPKEALGILKTLQGLGFNDQLLGSEKYVLEKLQSISSQDVERIKQAFVKYSHPRFMKAFSYHFHTGRNKHTGRK